MFISFIGSRGSGKTTVADIVSQELTAKGQKCLRQHVGLARRPFLKSLVTAILLWRFFDWETVKKIGFQGRKKQWLPSLYRFYLPLALTHDLEQLKDKKADTLIYDSNFLRGLMAAVSQEELSLKEISDFYARKILPKAGKILIVVIDTDPSLAVERWLSRDGVQISESEKQKAIGERLHFQKIVDQVVTTLSDIPNVSLLRLDGSTDAKSNAGLVVKEVTNSY